MYIKVGHVFLMNSTLVRMVDILHGLFLVLLKSVPYNRDIELIFD